MRALSGSSPAGDNAREYFDDKDVKRMATLRDVADRAGVTVTTVSRMLNGRVSVSEKTRNKIEEAMRDLGYRPNEMARALAKKKSNLIGLLVPSAKQYFFAELIQEVENAVAAQQCQLLLCISDQETEKENAYVQMLLGERSAASSWRATARALTGSRMPARRWSVSKESLTTTRPAP